MCTLMFVCAADIVFILKDKPHPRLTRDGNNLIYKPEIPLVKVGDIMTMHYALYMLFLYVQALCGGTVDVLTLDDRIITIPITEVIR